LLGVACRIPHAQHVQRLSLLINRVDDPQLRANANLIQVGSVRRAGAGYVYTSTDDGMTWATSTLPQGSWNTDASSADGSKLVVALGNNGDPSSDYIHISSDSGATWATSTSAGTGNWQRVTISADGTKLVANQYGGGVFTSTDGGTTWTKTSAIAYQHFWSSIASSADGTKLAAVENYGGDIYTSTDSGATWTDRAAAGSRNWTSITSSSDGTKLAAADDSPGYIYLSSDGGLTWATSTAAGIRYWYSVTSSADGTKLAAAPNGDSDYNPDYLYISSDGGTTWATSTSPGEQYWGAIAESAGGTKLIAVSNCDAACVTGDGTVWTSADRGATWTEQLGAGEHDWSAVTSSSDGSTLAAAPYGDVDYNPDYIWTSTDGGVTWTEQTTPGAENNWQGIALSADGTKLAATELGGDIWTSAVPSPALAPTPSFSGGNGMIVGSGPLAPSAAGVSGNVNPHPRIDYPNGATVYLVATTTASTSPPKAPRTAPAEPAISYEFSINRQLWSEGPDILALQQFLNAHGFTIATTGPGSPGQETDFFGLKTYQALAKFQAAHNLPATGYLGPLTRALIAQLQP
jgi:hypothetical protein